MQPALNLMPVTILTGFLGSGKSTVLNHLLRQPELAGVVAIINEFGEVALDHLLVEASQDRLALLDNGCICCSIREDLVETLKDIEARRDSGALPPFHRVLIETTGIADPVPILHTLMTSPDLVTRYRIDGVVAMADAVNGPHTLESHDEARRQIAVADLVLMTKADIASPGALARLEDRLEAINPTAARIVVANGKVAPALVLDAGMFDSRAKASKVAAWFAQATQSGGPDRDHHQDGCRGIHCDHPSHHAHGSAAARISTFSLVIDQPIREAAFMQWLDYVAMLKGEEMLRFKALINVAERPDGPVVVHGVQHVFHPPIALDGWPSEDRRSRLVFIVRDISRDVIEHTLSRFAAVSRNAIQRPAA